VLLLAEAVVAAPVVLAHQGGWDEMLLVAGPIGLFAWILHVANKRADAHQARRREASAEPPAAGDATTEHPDQRR
jgi:hypothetical protein